MKTNMIGIKGRFHTQVIENDKVVRDYGEHDNLVTDGAIKQASAISGVLAIGMGVVTEPAVTDTDLGNQVATGNWSGSTREATSDGVNFTIRRYGTVDFTGIEGEVSELGIRKSATGTLFTRALFKDESGNTTTISINADQTLRVTYSLYFVVPIILGSGTIETPFGTRQYEIYNNDGNESSVGAIISGRWEKALFYHDNVTLAVTFAHTYVSKSVDTENQKVTATMTFPAAEEDRIFSENGDYFIRPYSSPAFGPYIRFTEALTIPANYNFSITLEWTWGRI